MSTILRTILVYMLVVVSFGAIGGEDARDWDDDCNPHCGHEGSPPTPTTTTSTTSTRASPPIGGRKETSDDWNDPCNPSCDIGTSSELDEEFGIIISNKHTSGSTGTVFLRQHLAENSRAVDVHENPSVTMLRRLLYVKQCSHSSPSLDEDIQCRNGYHINLESDVHLYSNAVEVTLFSTDTIILQKVYVQTSEKRFEATRFYYITESASKSYRSFLKPQIGLSSTNELIKPRVYFDFSTFDNGEVEMKIYNTPPQVLFDMFRRDDFANSRNIPPTHAQLHLYYSGKQYHCQFKAASVLTTANSWHSCIWYLVQVDVDVDPSLFKVKISSNSLDKTEYRNIKILEQDGTVSFNDNINPNGNSYIDLEIKKSEWTVQFDYDGYSPVLDSFEKSRGDEVGRNIIVLGDDDNYDANGDCLTRGFVQDRVDMKRTDDSDTWNTAWTCLDTVIYLGLSVPASGAGTGAAGASTSSLGSAGKTVSAGGAMAARAGAAGLMYAGFSALMKAGSASSTAESTAQTALFEAIDEAFEEMEDCLKVYTDYRTEQVMSQHIHESLESEVSGFQHAWEVQISVTLSTLSDVSVDGNGGQIDQMYELWTTHMPDLSALYSPASSSSDYNIQKSRLFANNVWAILDERKLIYDRWLRLIKSCSDCESITDNMAIDANSDFKYGNVYYLKSYLSYISTLNTKYEENMYYLRNLWNVGHVCDRIIGTYLYENGRTTDPLTFEFVTDTLHIELEPNNFVKECPNKILNKVKADTDDEYNTAVTSNAGSFESSFSFNDVDGDCSNGFVYFGIRYFTNDNWRSGDDVGMVYYCRPKYVSVVNYFQYEVRAVSDMRSIYISSQWDQLSDIDLRWSNEARACPPGSAIVFQDNSPNGCKSLPLQSVTSVPDISGFTICLNNHRHAGLGRKGRIMARVWYIQTSMDMVATEWMSIATRSDFGTPGTCVHIPEFHSYEDEDWQYIDMYDCTADRFIMDAVGYLDSKQRRIIVNDFEGDCVINNGGSIEISHRWSQCQKRKISIQLETGVVYADPDWFVTPTCRANSAHQVPMTFNDIAVGVDGNSMIVVMWMVGLIILTAICTICNVYSWYNAKKRKIYQTVSVLSDTEVYSLK